MVLFTLRSCLPLFSPIVLGLIADEVRTMLTAAGDLGVPRRVLEMQGLRLRTLDSLLRVRVANDRTVACNVGGTSASRRQT